ncbi:hypothetical protein ACHAXT_010107 [Thalassiosira profunda]
MPPFRSQRYDPYSAGGTATATLDVGALSLPQGSTRRRGDAGRGRHGEGSASTSGFGGHPPISPSHDGSISRRRQSPPASGGGSLHERILGGHEGTTSRRRRGGPGGVDEERRGNDPRYNSSVDSWGEEEGAVRAETGAAPLGRQFHPLMELRKRPRSRATAGILDNPYSDGRRGPQMPHPLRNANGSNPLSQARRIVSLLLGQVPEEDMIASQKQQQYGLHGSTEEEILMSLLSAKSTVRIIRLFLLVPLLIFSSRRILPPLADRITRPQAWWWSAGVAQPGQKNVASRDLAGRNCVMNYFVEKQPPDEYDPDFQEIKPGEKNKDGTPKTRKPVKIVEGTYRTKGQVHVISRFVEAVADSFRSNTGIRQHIIFTEVRDSGHLAYEALKHWPPRGKHPVTMHVIASDELPHDDAGRNAARALGYGALEDIEEKFKGNEKAMIYDRDGNIAGVAEITEDMDDDEIAEALDIEVPDKETLELRLKSGGRRMKQSNATLLPDGTRPYPNLRALLPFEDDEDDDPVVVPYLHVDGTSVINQMLVLESARSMLEDNTIVVVGIEHSPDMDVRTLIEFFRAARYKTYFLGARQLARIDNLCDEVLRDVLDHPSVSLPKGGWFRRLFIRLGLISKEELRISGDGQTAAGPKRRETPPFFVAMPRGRRSKEEMTIQHMYDLFGGYGGGGGQIKTANDRKAPGK